LSDYAISLGNTGEYPMPEIAAFVADIKSAFGEQEIDEAIRRGRAGEPTFFACENGRSVGTANPVERMSVVLTAPCATTTTVTVATGRALEGMYPAAPD
jgi:hypothetical protein